MSQRARSPPPRVVPEAEAARVKPTQRQLRHMVVSFEQVEEEEREVSDLVSSQSIVDRQNGAAKIGRRVPLKPVDPEPETCARDNCPDVVRRNRHLGRLKSQSCLNDLQSQTNWGRHVRLKR